MQIVIDVDTDNPFHDAEGTGYFIPDLHAYISENILEILKKKGKVLPKGHGRLIDADILDEDKEIVTTVTGDYKYAVLMDNIRLIPTIIEEDKDEERKKMWMFGFLYDDTIKEKTEQWTKEAEEAGMTLTEYLESISPLNHKEDKNG